MTHPTRLFLLSSLVLVLFASAVDSVRADKPNFILIFADDMGYGDLSCFGSEKIRTPQIDRLAKEGRKLTSFMVASPVCTPSRAALLTGCYPKRVGLHQHVLFPTSTTGLHPDEHTIADHLKAQGYATACIGKWHLGHHPEVLPTANGFDSYFGIPYSNDMNHPDNKGKAKGGPDGMDLLWNDPSSTLTKWQTPLFEGEKIVELPVDQRTVTRRYTQKAIDFVTANQNQPFFLYLPHSMPHIPLYVPDDVRDPNPLNAYTNTIEHIDAEVGRLLDTLDELDLSKRTYVIFTSDNGPWLPFKHHGGSAGPLRDGKGSNFEGGQRVPFLIRGPGVPAGTVCDALAGSIDVLPSIAAITGNPLPETRKIDGLNVSGLWHGTAEASPRTEFVYYAARGALQGIRQGDWKLHMNRPDETPRPERPTAQAPPKSRQPFLFNLAEDLGEENNLAEAHPDLVAQLRARMEELDAEITENARATWTRP